MDIPSNRISIYYLHWKNAFLVELKASPTLFPPDLDHYLGSNFTANRLKVFVNALEIPMHGYYFPISMHHIPI